MLLNYTDGDSAPWCIAPNGEFDYCDIPECEKDINANNAVDEIIFGTPVKCPSDQFQCDIGECILSAYVCDGHRDCSNGKDERQCNVRELDKYDKKGGYRLNVPFVERWLDTTLHACSMHCKRAQNFKCRSFNYHAAKRLCTLNEENIGMSGKLLRDRQWDYYEFSSESMTCRADLKCPNGKCLKEEQVCDGKDDCGDNRSVFMRLNKFKSV